MRFFFPGFLMCQDAKQQSDRYFMFISVKKQKKTKTKQWRLHWDLSPDSSVFGDSSEAPLKTSALGAHIPLSWMRVHFLSQIDPTMFILQTCGRASNTLSYELGRSQMCHKRRTNNYTALEWCRQRLWIHFVTSLAFYF